MMSKQDQVKVASMLAKADMKSMVDRRFKALLEENNIQDDDLKGMADYFFYHGAAAGVRAVTEDLKRQCDEQGSGR